MYNMCLWNVVVIMRAVVVTYYSNMDGLSRQKELQMRFQIELFINHLNIFIRDYIIVAIFKKVLYILGYLMLHFLHNSRQYYD